MGSTGLPQSAARWRAVLAALVVAVIGLSAHAQAGAEVSAGAAVVLTLGLTVLFAGVAAGRLRLAFVLPVAALAQPVLHTGAELWTVHGHHDSLGEALACLVDERAMLAAHAVSVLLTTLALLLLEPVLTTVTQSLRFPDRAPAPPPFWQPRVGSPTPDHSPHLTLLLAAPRRGPPRNDVRA
jgi:hypothetical protein